MSENKLQAEVETANAETFVEGLDFYFDDGLMVLTRRFLLKRGFCCDGDCRHCPYEKHSKAALK